MGWDIGLVFLRRLTSFILIAHSCNSDWQPAAPIPSSFIHLMASSKIMSTNGHSESKSNALLTSSERETKKRLKSELKFQRRVKKLETRIKHAISRNDPVVEESAREELTALLSKNAGSSSGDQPQQQHIFPSCPSNDDARGKAALDEVLVIFRKLLASIDDDEQEKIRDEKIQQTEKARHLLRNMTKGTQSKSMFSDVTTLRGYARQKFHGRAALIIESLGKLSPNAIEAAISVLHNNLDSQQQQEQKQQVEIMKICWNRLGNIEKVCSLGCGPGNDAVGLTAFLRSYFNGKGPSEVAMLDYAIKEWKDAVLDDLVPILVPEYVTKIACESCDVTNQIANDTVEQFVKDSDIFLTSYLLTETRTLWDRFIVQLVGLAKVGALFYFAEPVPWQLHRLIRMSTGSLLDANPEIDYSPLRRLRFVWIDSSMYLPEMQKLDRRSGGPAVLLAIKV